VPGGVEDAGSRKVKTRAVAANAADESAAFEFDEVKEVGGWILASGLGAIDKDVVVGLEFWLDFPIAEEAKDGGMSETRFQLVSEGIFPAIDFTGKRVSRADRVLDYRNSDVVADVTIIQQIADTEPDFLENSVGKSG
jgi:hypothetical protein